jgi:membrane-bound lytic murein transglycosylase D
MTAGSLLAVYVETAVLLSVAAMVLRALARWGSAWRAPERCLTWVWALLALCVALPVAGRTTRIVPTAAAPVEIWGGPRLDDDAAALARVTFRWGEGGATRTAGLPLRRGGERGLLALAAGGALVCGLRLAWRYRAIARRCAALPVVKALGRVRVCACDETAVPFAARGRGWAFVVVPTSLLSDHARLRIVVAHEVHHHRRRDLRAAALLGIVRALFFWNPLLSPWGRVVAELQDHACDRHVVLRRGVEPLEYGRVLLWAAEAGSGRRYAWPGTPAMACGSSRSLRRRVMMLSDRQGEALRTGSWLLGAAGCVLLASTSWAVQAAVADHRVDRAEVQAIAARVEQRSGFPVLVDERVVAKLNEWVADPAARERIKAALERMPGYRPMIERTLRQRALPLELLGVPLAESAFDNEAHPDRPAESRAAGLWQIIPETGRRLGLSVTPQNDERLDPRRATEAAAELMARLFARYGDWPVAIAAYNAGENTIDALAAGGAKPQARERVLAGDREHARYVRAVMASVILIEQPSILD